MHAYMLICDCIHMNMNIKHKYVYIIRNMHAWMYVCENVGMDALCMHLRALHTNVLCRI